MSKRVYPASPSHVVLAGHALTLATIQGTAKGSYSAFESDAAANAAAVTPVGAEILSTYLLHKPPADRATVMEQSRETVDAVSIRNPKMHFSHSPASPAPSRFARDAADLGGGSCFTRTSRSNDGSVTPTPKEPMSWWEQRQEDLMAILVPSCTPVCSAENVCDSKKEF